MSISSLEGLIVTAAKEIMDSGGKWGANDAINTELEKLESRLANAYGEASGYKAAVSVKYRSCEKKKCWRLKSYWTWGGFKIKGDTRDSFNPDPAAFGGVSGSGFMLPNDAKALKEAEQVLLKEIINGLE
jgi:hypothetical protein